MKGLLLKDWRIIAAQKRYMIMVGAIGVFMALTQENMSFCVMYMTMIATIMSVSTLNYDSYEENGMAYLMTLPVKRSMYAVEKYLFTFIVVGSVSLLFSLLGLLYTWMISGVLLWKDTLLYFLVAIVMGLMMMALMIPVNLKFGAEKSRVAMMIFGGGVLVISYVLKKAMDSNPKVMEWLSGLEKLSGWQWGILLAAVVVLVLAVSVGSAIYVIGKKEF